MFLFDNRVWNLIIQNLSFSPTNLNTLSSAQFRFIQFITTPPPPKKKTGKLDRLINILWTVLRMFLVMMNPFHFIFAFVCFQLSWMIHTLINYVLMKSRWKKNWPLGKHTENSFHKRFFLWWTLSIFFLLSFVFPLLSWTMLQQQHNFEIKIKIWYSVFHFLSACRKSWVIQPSNNNIFTQDRRIWKIILPTAFGFFTHSLHA